MRPAYLRPDSMNLSYSTDILQHSACRVRTAEQLVLMTRLPGQVETQENEGPRPLVPELEASLGLSRHPAQVPLQLQLSCHLADC